MSHIRITKELVCSVMGIGSENVDGDESSLSTLHVRMDQLWREAVMDFQNVITIHADDLEKLIDFNPQWKAHGRTLQTPKYELRVGEPVGPHLLRIINLMAASLAEATAKPGKLVFAQSPQFSYQRLKEKYEFFGWTHCVSAPEASQEPEHATP